MDFLNHVWDSSNANRYGTIEGADTGLAPVPVYQAAAYSAAAYPAAALPTIPDLSAITGDMINNAIDQAPAPINENQEQTDNILKSHIEKLKTIVGKTETEKKTDEQIKQTKQVAAQSIHQE
jgi:hypothetical protein